MSVCANYDSPQVRFKKHFDNWVRWGIDKNLDRTSSPTEAFEKSNYLLFPKSRRSYLCLDLDWEGSASIWMDEGLPEPTITFVNQKNSHGNLAYEITKPIHWPCTENLKTVRSKPVEYFNAIRRGYENKTSADPGYTNASIKNPFSTRWKVYWADKSYSLDYLAEFVTLSNKRNYSRHGKNNNYSGRNEELFYIARKWACYNVKKHENYESFQNSLQEYLLDQNVTTIIMNWSTRGSLDISEVKTISRGVSRYIWEKRDDINYKHLFKNYGILNFNDIPFDIPKYKKDEIIKERQSLGASYTHNIRKINTLKLLEETIYKLHFNNKNINYRTISIESGISYKTVLSYKSFISNFKNILLRSKS